MAARARAAKKPPSDGSVVVVNIKNVPKALRNAMKARAALEGLYLGPYLIQTFRLHEELIRLAHEPGRFAVGLREVLDRMELPGHATP